MYTVVYGLDLGCGAVLYDWEGREARHLKVQKVGVHLATEICGMEPCWGTCISGRGTAKATLTPCSSLKPLTARTTVAAHPAATTTPGFSLWWGPRVWIWVRPLF